MNDWKELAGKWHGEMIDVFGGAVWEVELDLQVGWSGRPTGSGLLTSLVGVDEEAQQVRASGSLRQGLYELLFTAPDRFETGVCWQHSLHYDPVQGTLMGEGSSWESPTPDVPEAGEPGSMKLSRSRG